MANAAVLSAFCQGLAAGSPDFFSGLAVHPAHLAEYQTHNLWVTDTTSQNAPPQLLTIVAADGATRKTFASPTAT
jgi:hypothetical protein